MSALAQVAPAPTAPVGVRAVDVMRGSRDGSISRQWYARPDDQRFLSLDALAEAVRGRAAASTQRVVEASSLLVRARDDDQNALWFETEDGMATPTHWSFGQACSLVGAPPSYLRKLPAQLTAINLQYGLKTHRAENVKTYVNTETGEMRAITGPDYGRITDIEVVEAIHKVAGNGVGDTHWKVPGVLDWGAGRYNPFVDVTKETTTLYASDRDVFVFLADDTRPIEIGKLPNGDPDLIFRGFYVWNSEVGARSLGIATFWLRAVCQNRNLWGVENKDQLLIRHSKGAPERFLLEAQPALERYAHASPDPLLAGIKAAKATVVADNDESRAGFLPNLGFGKGLSKLVLDTVVREEGKPAENVWDFVNGLTAVARGLPHQDARLDLEREAARLMAKAAKLAA